MNKIQNISLFFIILFRIAFVAIPIGMLIAWIKAPAPLFDLHGPFSCIANMAIPQEYPVLHPLNFLTKVLGFLVSMIPTTFDLIILGFLIKLFSNYKNSEIFSLNNVRYLRNIGYTLFIGQLLSPIYECLIGLVLTWGNGHGHRFITITFDNHNVGVLLLALLMILTSWIMAEAYKLQEEQQLTI